MARKRRDDERDDEPRAADDPGPGPGPVEAQPTAGLTPEEREEIDRVNAEVKQTRQRLAEAKLRLDGAKADHKACQADYDAAVAAMVEVTDEILHPNAERYPLFVQPGKGREPERIAGHADRAWRDDEWRPDRLADAIPEVGGHVLHVLDESEIRTMGDLADWTTSKRLDQIAGIGEAKARAIEDAVIAYWSRKNAARDEAESEAEDGTGSSPAPEPDESDETAA